MNMKVTLTVSLLIGLLSFHAYGQQEQSSLIVNGDDLSCSRYNGEDYFYAELDGDYDIPNTVFDHRFSRFLFSDSCAQVDALKGSAHKVSVNVKALPYNATICERGSIWYCHQYGCYRYHVEYVDMTFPNELKLSSEVHTASDQATRLHDGRCASER